MRGGAGQGYGGCAGGVRAGGCCVKIRGRHGGLCTCMSVVRVGDIIISYDLHGYSTILQSVDKRFTQQTEIPNEAMHNSRGLGFSTASAASDAHYFQDSRQSFGTPPPHTHTHHPQVMAKIYADEASAGAQPPPADDDVASGDRDTLAVKVTVKGDKHKKGEEAAGERPDV